MTKRSTWEQRGKGLVERFEEKVKKGAGCWLWQSAFGTNGYGFFWVGGKKRQEYAHRVAWRIANDWQEVPEGKVVMHSCDNPCCIEPEHLFLGTQPANIADMDRKGRRRTLKGSERSTAKLSEADIPVIRQRLRGGESCEKICIDYRVSPELIRHIKKGRIWTHVQ